MPSLLDEMVPALDLRGLSVCGEWTERCGTLS